MTGVGDTYQKETKYHRGKLGGGHLDWSTKPDVYKRYPDSPIIELPQPQPPLMSLSETLKKRKSIRRFSKTPLTREQLSYLLWAATGIQRKEYGMELRTAPSAGALFPLETYVIANNVEDVQRGVYHYSVETHTLEELNLGDFRRQITEAALNQDMCFECAAVFVWTAIFYRSKWKYRERAYRYIYLDAGHIGQNCALAAVSLGLGSCQVGAFFDDDVNRIIGVDGTEESTVYMTVVGYPL